ncbi:MAG: hypothetical protein QME28_05825 [Candidatus Saccharicenans sp.]|nr:hypothetical protein [Candidatus Saccharicenans sp.]
MAVCLKAFLQACILEKALARTNTEYFLKVIATRLLNRENSQENCSPGPGFRKGEEFGLEKTVDKMKPEKMNSEKG